MASSTPIRLFIELDRGVEPIRGTLGSEPGAGIAFNGLLELVHLLDRERGAFDPHRKDGPG